MSEANEIKTVVVIGTGVIGASYTALFLSKGLKVIVSPSKENGAEKLKEAVAKAWPVLEKIGLAEGASQSNLEFVDDVMKHLDRADFVQEVGNSASSLNSPVLSRFHVIK
jgi:3-hydroxyacyl-CoA dehydrogenase